MSEIISLTIEKNETFLLPVDSTINLQVNRTLITPFYRNKVIFASLSDNTKVVAKIQSRPEKDSINLHEWKALCIAYKHGVSVPEPIALAKDNENRIVLLMKEVEGPLLYDDPQPNWVQKFGRTVGNLHNIILDTESLDPAYQLNIAFYQDWELKLTQDEYFQKNSHDLKILNNFALKNYVHLQAAPLALLHHDLHHSQAIVSSISQQVVLIDFERWHSGDPISDIAVYLYHLIRQNQPSWCLGEFLSGYINSRTLCVHLESLLKYYLLFTSARAVCLFKDWPSWRERSILTHQKVLEYIQTDQLKRSLTQLEY